MFYFKVSQTSNIEMPQKMLTKQPQNIFNEVFFDKVIMSVMLKYLSPMSFLVLKRTVPAFYRCGVVKNLTFIQFFEKKLFNNLCDFFYSVDIANILMKFLKSSNHHTHLLTGSFLLNTLNGDDISNSGDIDIVHFGNECACLTHHVQLYTEDGEIVEKYSIRDELEYNHFITNTDAYTYNNHSSNRYIEKIQNIMIGSKKIQVIDVHENNIKHFFDGFDLNVCKNYYNEQFGMYIPHKRNIIERTCEINLDNVYFLEYRGETNIFELCDMIYERLCKYSKRGYHIKVVLPNMNLLRNKIGKFKDVTKYDEYYNQSFKMKEEIEVYFPNADKGNVDEFVEKQVRKNLFEILAHGWVSFWNRKKRDLNCPLTFCESRETDRSILNKTPIFF